MDDERDEWRSDVTAFVLDVLPRSPRRILEVGCGDGWLVATLRRRGFDAHGVDPDAPADVPHLTRSRLEEFDTDRRFDAVIAVLPLHHVDDLDRFLDTVEGLVAPNGLVVVVEFAWDRFDDATVQWSLERLPDQVDEDNWLQGMLAVPDDGDGAGTPPHPGDRLRTLAAEHGFHTSVDVLDGLRRRFAEERFEWVPYLYPDLTVDAAAERAAIEAGTIAATSYRFVGRSSGRSRAAR